MSTPRTLDRLRCALRGHHRAARLEISTGAFTGYCETRRCQRGEGAIGCVQIPQ